MSKANYYKLRKNEIEGNSSNIPYSLIKSTIMSDAEKIFIMNLMKYTTELSYNEMALNLGIGRSTVKRYITALKKKNVISINDNGVITLLNENN